MKIMTRGLMHDDIFTNATCKQSRFARFTGPRCQPGSRYSKSNCISISEKRTNAYHRVTWRSIGNSFHASTGYAPDETNALSDAKHQSKWQSGFRIELFYEYELIRSMITIIITTNKEGIFNPSRLPSSSRKPFTRPLVSHGPLILHSSPVPDSLTGAQSLT